MEYVCSCTTFAISLCRRTALISLDFSNISGGEHTPYIILLCYNVTGGAHSADAKGRREHRKSQTPGRIGGFHDWQISEGKPKLETRTAAAQHPGDCAGCTCYPRPADRMAEPFLQMKPIVRDLVAQKPRCHAR